MASLQDSKYPIDPSKQSDPLKHLKRNDWKPSNNKQNPSFLTQQIFDSKWIIDKTLYKNHRNKIVSIISKKDNDEQDKDNNSIKNLIKVYQTRGDDKVLLKRYKEYIFITNTKLIEYNAIYHNPISKEIYIEMPYYGKSLKHEIKTFGPISDENKVKSIAWDLLDKIWIMHNSGFVHCDIKPSNIVKRDINNNNSNDIINGWKLIDFELMHAVNSKGKYNGTMGWTAPELHPSPKGKTNKYKPEIDIFAWGLVILYILFGTQPLEITKAQRVILSEDIEMKMMDDYHGDEDEKYDDKPVLSVKEVKKKVNTVWYETIVTKSEHKIQNYLVKRYYEDKISLDLFHLLLHGVLVYDVKKRWDCKRIYECKWFTDLREGKVGKENLDETQL